MRKKPKYRLGQYIVFEDTGSEVYISHIAAKEYTVVWEFGPSLDVSWGYIHAHTFPSTRPDKEFKPRHCLNPL